MAWNSDAVDDLDLDQPPAGRSYWTSTVVDITLGEPTGGGSLPAGYGGIHFDFEASLSFEVTYS